MDDDEDICQNMADIFIDLGYEVDVAHEGRAALELVRKRPYDVALLDLKMPGMDGLTLYREIKKLQSGMVAFLVTAYAGGSVADQAITAGSMAGTAQAGRLAAAAKPDRRGVGTPAGYGRRR